MVKDVFADEHGTCLNIILYAWNGERIGRRSPPEGGPTAFEPACPADQYGRIKAPAFPLKRNSLNGDYSQELKFL
jgi:hypothetical protein